MRAYIYVFPKERASNFKAYALDFERAASQEELESLARKLFCDPVTEKFLITSKPERSTVVWLKEGVYDAEGDMAGYITQRLSLSPGLKRVKFGRGYTESASKLSLDEYNPLVESLSPSALNEHAQNGHKEPEAPPADEWALLGFSGEEIAALKRFYAKVGRKPTLAELEMTAQAWSEHTRHKTLRGSFESNDLHYKNLLGETVFAATQKLNKPWVLSAFKDNAGMIELDSIWAVAVKLETHNHPSALHPYGGASTGMGGVIRDVLGAGRAAQPIAGIDVFCVSDKEPHMLKGVAGGVADYGNRMGIPTVAGAIVHDDSFTGIPLVYAGCIGLVPKDCVEKPIPNPGELIYVIGGKTGRDGIHGATFSSMELAEGQSASVVQIGNPILEKKVLDFLMEARDKNFYRSITDLGAGGIACAIWEMADLGKNLGLEASLDAVPLKEPGMRGWEILVSESQERMMISVEPARRAEIEKMLNDFELDFACLGKFTPGAHVSISYQGQSLVDLPLKILKELPKRSFTIPGTLRRELPNPPTPNSQLKTPDWSNARWLKSQALKVLSSPNIASKESVIERYDHEVGGRTVLKPQSGPRAKTPTDGSVLKPLRDSKTGIAIGLGHRVLWAKKDAYLAAWGAVEEALRNIAVLGGGLRCAALLDNYCAGSTQNIQILKELAQASQALHDASLLFDAPFISGKDSLNNATAKRQIPTMILVTAVGIVENTERLLSPALKKPGNWIYAVGATHEELGGSEFAQASGYKAGSVPTLSRKLSPLTLKKISKLLSKDLAASAHDVSEGGLFTALAEMMIGTNHGLEADLAKIPASTPNPAALLFSESNSRFILEIEPSKVVLAEKELQGVPFARIGKVSSAKNLNLKRDGKPWLSWSLKDLEKAFNGKN